MACRPFRSGSALLAFARAEASLFEKKNHKPSMARNKAAGQIWQLKEKWFD
jgi:hypothetical protein